MNTEFESPTATENGREATVRVVHVQSTDDQRHSWWLVWLMASIGVLLIGISVAATLYVANTWNQHYSQRFECWARFSSEVADEQQNADRSLNDLASLMARQLISDTPPVRETFETLLNRLEADNDAAGDAVRERDDWIVHGSPLPCPLD